LWHVIWHNEEYILLKNAKEWSTINMLGYLGNRLLTIIPTLIVLTLVVFLVAHLTPGDPIMALAGLSATAEDIERLREAYGLNRPLHVQYLSFMKHLLQGDLGRSIVTGRPVLEEVLYRLPNSMILAALSVSIALGIGIPTGIISAKKQDSLTDGMFRVGALILVSVPTFWLGLMGIWLFAVELNLLPSFGIGIKEAILPSIVLGTTTLAITSRQTRSAMIEVLGREYIIAAKAKGLSDRAIIYTHALKNALIPIITVAGMQFGVLIGSAVITETVFSWPGLGKLLVEAIQTKDYPVIQGGILSFAIVFSMVNLIVDIFYVYLDPRLRF